jgi:hypothetical protein
LSFITHTMLLKELSGISVYNGFICMELDEPVWISVQ